mmetsp:Transcript_12828/g.17877  ORF Transcript_12828/g.17877 Transcript_12828/m.17877 type:complete len:94 (+) Transcript_12828:449-730(+)
MENMDVRSRGCPAPIMKAMSSSGQFQQVPTKVRTTGAVRCDGDSPSSSKSKNMGVHKHLPDFSQKYCPSFGMKEREDEEVDDDDHPKDQVASQ